MMDGEGRKWESWAGAGIFFGALLIRSGADLVFFLRHGWFSSHLIEVWFYYGVARGAFALTPLDPTFLLLRLPGLILPPPILYQATVFLASAVSALTAWLIYFWLRRRYGFAVGLWGGIGFALLPAPITLSLANFSHDLVAIPLIVIFFGAAEFGEEGRGQARALALAVAAVCLILGLAVGPLIAGALAAVILSLAWPLFRRTLGRLPEKSVSVLCLGTMILVSYLLFLVMRENLLDWIAPLALRFRGIDLAAQVTIQVGDLQPLPPQALWNRYTLLVFLLPWGFWTAFRERDFFALSLFLFALALSLAVNRGARLLDLAVVLLAARGLAGWKKPAPVLTASWSLLLLLGNLTAPEIARALRLSVPFIPRLAPLFAGFFALGLAGPFLVRPGKPFRVVLLLLPAVFLQPAWVLSVARTSSDEIEYRAYRRLDDLARPGEKIFAAWNQGYFIGSVTALVPLATPERIDHSLTRLYWEEEEAAVEELRRRNVRYVHVSSRYFGITSVSRETDTFAMRGSTIIGPRPDHIRRFSRMRRTFLFRMLYEPAALRRLEPVVEKRDPESGLLVRIFRLVTPDES